MSSSAAGPFHQTYPSSSAQTPFQRLKPVCVQLLSLTGRTTGASRSSQIVACLRRLKTTLAALISEHASDSSIPCRYSNPSTDPTWTFASTSKLVPPTSQAVLTPSLINYVFYPLSELISTAPRGIRSLSHLVAELTLDVLALLCTQWWTAWASHSSAGSSLAVNNHWQIWCDLVILSSSVLGSPTSKDGSGSGQQRQASDEVKLSAMGVLSELLSPRFRSPHPLKSESEPAPAPSQTGWEWDGVSQLPLLDEMEDVAHDHPAHHTVEEQPVATTHLTLVFPSPDHLSYVATDKVAKGAVSFVLSSCFTVAESSQECNEVRSAAIHVARAAILVWIGGTCPLPSMTTQQSNELSKWLDIPSLHYIHLHQASDGSKDEDRGSAQSAVSQRLRPLLPGITSSLTRLATSRLKPRHDGFKQKITPGSVSAAALELLALLFRATLSEECLRHVIAESAPVSHIQSPAATRVTDLEDFARLESQNDQKPQIVGAAAGNKTNSAQEGSTVEDNGTDSASKDAQWALSTLAQVHLALKTFSPLTQPSLSGTLLPSAVHSSVQKAILHLAMVLLSECAGSFIWLDEQLEGMARLNATSASTTDERGLDSSNSSSVNTLLTWIIDLASDHNSVSVRKCAKAAFDALQRSTSGRGDGRSSALRGRLNDGSALWSVLTQALGSLPSAIMARNDSSVSRLALRVSTALSLLSEQARTQSSFGLVGLAKLAQDVQHTSVWLIRPLKVEQLNHVEEAAELPGSTTWRLQPVFSGLEASTSSQLSVMFFSFGRSLAVSLVHELKAKRQNASTKVDVNHLFFMITSLIERAARLRSVRLEVGSTLESVQHEETSRRDESLTSLVVAADMLRGVGNCLENLELGFQFADMGAGAAQASKQARKVAHKLGKKVFSLVMDMLDGDAEEAIVPRTQSGDVGQTPRGMPHSGQLGDDISGDVSLAAASSETMLVERVKGISLASDNVETTTPDRLGPVLDLGFVRAANLSKSTRGPASQIQTELAVQHRYRQAQHTLDLSNALLFSLLSSTSKLLGQSFRKLLLRGSYALISGMSASSTASSELVRLSSSSTMRDIAFNTAYADVKNCLLDNADYILGSACQRLISGLDEELRAIASASTNVRGGPRATLVRNRGDGKGAREDLVVLPLVSAQRAPFVLVEMIRVLGSEIVPMVEDAIDEVLDALDRFHQHATICDGLLAVLDSILETMAAEQASRGADAAAHTAGAISSAASEFKRTEMDDFAAWLASRQHEQTAYDGLADGDGGANDNKEEKEDKPSKSQQVASQILTKAVAFLTHPSPMLRSRVLGLLRHGIETLAPQSRTPELLPIVNSAWPFVMTRLGCSYSSTKSSSSQLSPIIDLTPTAIGTTNRTQDETWYRKLEATFVETDPHVWIAAARFVESAAKNVPEYVGKRVVEEAWPRFEQLLKLMRWKFDPSMSRHGVNATRSRVAAGDVGRQRGGDSNALLDSEISHSSDGTIGLIEANPSEAVRGNARPSQRPTSTSHVHVESPFILASASSVPAQLTLCILTTLTTVVRHLNARMPDDAAWSITCHRFVLDLLDARQPAAIVQAAEELYMELGKRNPEATIWAIQAAFPTAAAKALHTAVETPCFMLHARSNVHAETVHCIVSSFTAF